MARPSRDHLASPAERPRSWKSSREHWWRAGATATTGSSSTKRLPTATRTAWSSPACTSTIWRARRERRRDGLTIKRRRREKSPARRRNATTPALRPPRPERQTRARFAPSAVTHVQTDTDDETRIGDRNRRSVGPIPDDRGGEARHCHTV